MEKSPLPAAGGFGAAALLAFFLGPWNGQGINPTTTGASGSHNHAAHTQDADNTPSSIAYSLSKNEQGPWYALCQAFSTIDPEDLETKPTHSAKQEAGIEIHPPLIKDAERVPEEITEETVTKGKIQQKFVPHYHYRGDIASCLPSGNLSGHLDLRYIIATIPDPLGSHLALQFDRNIVAIERAAEANGYGFERYWFPWSGLLQAQQNQHRADSSETLKQLLREQPGFLIFRQFSKFSGNGDSAASTNYSPRLLVFLVGETPTAGINKIAFTKAARYIVELTCRATDGAQCADSKPSPSVGSRIPCQSNLPVDVLGPNFSASFSPLYRAIQDIHDLRSERLCIHARILSPTTTVDTQRSSFQKELGNLGTFVPIAPLDDCTETTLLSYLSTLGYRPEDIAYLSEDETSYTPGSETSDLKSPCLTSSQGTKYAASLPRLHIPTLTYPRDLSALRNTWEPTSIAITPADISGEMVNTQIIPFSLHEQTSNELDSPVAFATDQAAPDIDQALSNIITTMRHRHYRVIIVTASNPLDEVYLLQYIRHNAPDIRLATYDQDSLMLREANFDTLRGTISATSFPLTDTLWLHEENPNTGSRTDTDTAGFPNSAAEATFIGLHLLINDNLLNSSPTPGSTLIDYLGKAPGVFLLGYDSFWATRRITMPPQLRDFLLERRANIPWIWYIFLAGLVGLTVAHLWTHRKLYLPHRPVATIEETGTLFRRMRLRGSRRNEDLLQDYFLFIANNQLVMLLFLFGLPSLVLGQQLIGWHHSHFPATASEALRLIAGGGLLASEFSLFVAMLSISVLLMVRATRTSAIIHSNEKLKASATLGLVELIVAAIYPVVTMFIVACFLFEPGEDVSRTSYRAIYVMDGLSPILVISAIIAVWYLFAVMGLGGTRTIKAMKVDPLFLSSELPECSVPWLKGIGQAQRELLCSAESMVRANSKDLTILLASFAVLLVLRIWPALRGVDYSWLRGWLVFGGIGLLSASIMVSLFRVWKIWSLLKSLLAILAASPVAPGFERVPEETMQVKLWRSFEKRQSSELQNLTLISLRRIATFCSSQTRTAIAPYLSTAELYVQNLAYNSPFTQEPNLHNHTVLNFCFDACISPSIGDDPCWLQQQCEQNNAFVIDYMALRYVALIKYVNSQVRWLLWFILYGFVFLLIGVKSYPFEGQQTVSSVLTIILAVSLVFSALLFVQMDSNRVLSKLERSATGKTNYFEAALRFLSVGVIPLIAVLASQFPIVARFVLSWVKPTLESLH